MRNTTSLFNFIDDPIIVADSFESDGSSFREIGKELLDGAGLMIDPGALNG